MGDPIAGGMSPETKEMIARLQKENENLKLQVDEKGITDTDLELLRDELKDRFVGFLHTYINLIECWKKISVAWTSSFQIWNVE